jgi:hypothetical protein
MLSPLAPVITDPRTAAFNVGAMSNAERTSQRNAVLAGFLGWTFDAFDFFVLTLVDDVARSFGPNAPRHRLALTAPEAHGVSFRKIARSRRARIGALFRVSWWPLVRG